MGLFSFFAGLALEALDEKMDGKISEKTNVLVEKMQDSDVMKKRQRIERLHEEYKHKTDAELKTIYKKYSGEMKIAAALELKERGYGQ